MNKKNLIIVITSLYNGGAEKSLVNFLNELDSEKYNVDLLMFKREGLFLSQIPNWVNVISTPNEIMNLYGVKYAYKKNFKLLFVRYFGTFVSRMFYKEIHLRSAFRWKYFFSKKISNYNKYYDVALSYVSGDILYFVSEKINAKKKIVWIHNDYKTAQHPKKYDYPHLKKMDYIVSISDTCVDILKNEFPEFTDKIVCLHNITSSKVIRRRSEEFIPTEYQKDDFNILSIGRLSNQKGFDLAIDASRILKDMGYQFKWYIIGDGSDKEKLLRKIIDNNLNNIVNLLGVKENPYPYISNCNLFVQTSRYEGKSVVLDEAKILNRPILSTNYPTVSDQLQNGVEGIVVNISAVDIARGIAHCIDCPEEVDGYIASLRMHEYGNQHIIEDYYDIID